MNLFLQITIVALLIFIFMVIITMAIYFLLKQYMVNYVLTKNQANETATNLKNWTLHLEDLFLQTLNDNLENYKNVILDEFMIAQRDMEEMRLQKLLSLEKEDEEEDELSENGKDENEEEDDNNGSGGMLH